MKKFANYKHYSIEFTSFVGAAGVVGSAKITSNATPPFDSS